MKLSECKIGDVVTNNSGTSYEIVKMDDKLADLKCLSFDHRGVLIIGDTVHNVSIHHGDWILLKTKSEPKEFKLRILKYNQASNEIVQISKIVKSEKFYFEGLDENKKLIIISAPYILEQI